MHKILKYKKFLAGFLVAALIAPFLPLVVLAQTIPVAGASSSSQSGNALSSIVQDTTGAVAAAAIACNKQNIQSGIASLFSTTGTTVASGAGAAAEYTSSSNSISQITGYQAPTAPAGGGPGISNYSTGLTSSSSDGGVTVTDNSTGVTTTAATTTVTPTSTSTSDQQVHLNPSSPANTNIAAIASSVSTIANNSSKTTAAVVASTNKVTCTDAIEKAAASVILRQLTISTVNWINHGLNGNPFYSTDTASALKSVADTAIKSLTSTLGFDSKNYPFGKAVAQSIASEVGTSYAQQAKYSLNAVIAQQYPGMTSADFQKNFAIGGWEAFLAQTALNNNPFGFSMQAQNVAANSVAGTSYSPAQDLKDQLARSGGFFDQKVCVDPNYNPSANVTTTAAAASADEDAYAASQAAWQASGNQLALAEGTGDAQAIATAQQKYDSLNKQSAQAAATMAQAETAATNAQSQSVCNKYQVQTPGSVIGNTLSKDLGATTDTLVNGQNLSTDITAVFNALMNQLVNKGLSSLSTTNASSSNFANNSNGTAANNQPSVDVSGQTGSWDSQGAAFNVFTDIPSAIRYEDNSQNLTSLATGCTSAVGFSPSGQFCAGDPTLPEGYQQILEQEINTEQEVVASTYELDYCIPGPHPGAIDSIEQNATNYVENPNLFPQSVDASTLHKFLANYGKTIGILAGAATGAAIGSAAGPWGAVIGAVAGAITGAILQAIANDQNFQNEDAYGPFVSAILGVDINYKDEGRADVNGFSNSANIITTLASRYGEAMEMTYAPTEADMEAVTTAAASNPNGTLGTGVPDLSTTNAVRLKIETAGYDTLSGPAADLNDIESLDNTEYAKISNHTSNVAENEALFLNSQSVEDQLERLLIRIQDLPQQDGYPGLTGPLSDVPSLTLNGNPITTLNVGAAFIDPGVKATDPTDGDVTSKVVTSNNVDTTTPGIYTITYDVTNSNNVAATQVTRTVRVVDASGNVGPVVPNPAVKNYSIPDVQAINTPAGFSALNSAAAPTVTVRDYNSDLLAVQSLNAADLTPYEAELVRISNTFQQLAPYIHGLDDLNQEQANLDTLENEQSEIAYYPSGTSTDQEPKSGALKDCIDGTAAGSLYQKDGGPLERLPFSFTTSSNNTTMYSLPSWLTTLLPPSYSFLPDWHYAQGNGILVMGKDWFKGDGEPAYPAGVAGQQFFFTNYHGNTMTAVDGVPAVETSGPASLDDNKLIRNDDVASLNLQPLQNAFKGIENIAGMY